MSNIIQQPRDLTDLYQARALNEQPSNIDYQIPYSGSFDGLTGYLSRIFGTPTDQQVYTYAFYFKPSKLSPGVTQTLLSGTNTTDKGGAVCYSFSTNTIGVHGVPDNSGNSIVLQQSSEEFRAPYWQHFVITQEADGTVTITHDGVLVTELSVDLPSAAATNHAIGSATLHEIGQSISNGAEWLDGLLTEVYFIDGQSVAATEFGELDFNGWKPKKYSGTYGNNGFYIPDPSTGIDESGNDNHWTVNGTITQSTDTPTNISISMDPLQTGQILSNRNMQIDVASTDLDAVGDISVSGSGKYLIGFKLNADTSGGEALGWCNNDSLYPNSDRAYTANSGVYAIPTATGVVSRDDGNPGSVVTDTTLASGDYYFGLLDLDNATITHGTYNGSMNWLEPISIPADRRWKPFAELRNVSSSVTFITDDREIRSKVGDVKFSNDWSPREVIDPDVSQHFETLLWTGDGNLTRDIAVTPWLEKDGSYSDELILLKNRTRPAGLSYTLYTSLRGFGPSKSLSIDAATAESSSNADAANGYINDATGTLINLVRGSSGDPSYTNTDTHDYVAWRLRAGKPYTDTSGTISATVSTNRKLGFSIVEFAGNGIGGATIPHGLGKKPGLIVVKSTNLPWGWFVYHGDIGAGNRLELNTSGGVNPSCWNDTEPTSEVFTLGDSNFPEVNSATGEYIALCFTNSDFIDIGIWSGNGNDDNFYIDLGGEPIWILRKPDATTGPWAISDTARSPYNPVDKYLSANLIDAESTTPLFDSLRSGPKYRNAALTVSEIYMAIKKPKLL